MTNWQREADPREADIDAIISVLRNTDDEYYMNEIALMEQINHEGCMCNKNVQSVEFVGVEGITMPIAYWTYHNGKVTARPDAYTFIEQRPIAEEDYEILWNKDGMIHPNYINLQANVRIEDMRREFVQEAVRIACLLPLLSNMPQDVIYDIATHRRTVEYYLDEEEGLWHISFPLMEGEE